MVLMTDLFNKVERSKVMSRISSRGNLSTEIAFLRLLRKHHISGWRRHLLLVLKTAPSAARTDGRRLRVRPDFVFKSIRLVVFVDGCFWHGCPRHGEKPTANAVFWRTKLNENQRRDRHVTRALRRQNWRVLRIWEHQLLDGERIMVRVVKLCGRPV